jgi:hypothetical protein
LRRAERDNERLLRLAEQTRAPEPRKPDPPPEPAKTLKDFNYDEAAFARHLREEVAREAAQAVKQELSQAQEQQRFAERTKSFRTREMEFAKTVEDYTEVAHFAPISSEVADMVKELDNGPEVAYYLGKNPDLAEKISALSERSAAIELGKIEARLSAEREKLKSKSAPKAPPPPPRIDGASAEIRVKPDEPDSDQLSDQEWARRRNLQLSKRRS